MAIAEDPNAENAGKKQHENVENVEETQALLSPRFRSVAAMAGWDEEALLIASLVVEDTPVRESKHKKRTNSQNFRSPQSNSRRKRRVPRRSPPSIRVPVLDLDEDSSTVKQEMEIKRPEPNDIIEVEKEKAHDDAVVTKDSCVSSPSTSIPCIDRLREELSCAICLEICFEPSTTPCGHSFCKKCLRSAADKCGKRCPKCRQLISNGRSCTVNTVLWNTIQLLFPQEVETRKATAASNSAKTPEEVTERVIRHNTRNRTVEALNSPESEPRAERRNRHRSQSLRPAVSRREEISVRRTELPSQDEDAALALRLQREEFMEAFRGSSDERRSSSLAQARANLRAMASRAMNIRIRGRTGS